MVLLFHQSLFLKKRWSAAENSRSVLVLLLFIEEIIRKDLCRYLWCYDKCSMHPQCTVLSFVQLSTPNPRTRLNQFSAPWRTSLSDLSATDGPTVNNVASSTTSEVLQTAMQRFQACILKGDVSSRCLFTHFGCCLLPACRSCFAPYQANLWQGKVQPTRAKILGVAICFHFAGLAQLG